MAITLEHPDGVTIEIALPAVAGVVGTTLIALGKLGFVIKPEADVLPLTARTGRPDGDTL